MPPGYLKATASAVADGALEEFLSLHVTNGSSSGPARRRDGAVPAPSAGRARIGR